MTLGSYSPTVKTADEAQALIPTLSRGERFFYHFGDLAHDRLGNRPLHNLANTILRYSLPPYYDCVDGYDIHGLNLGALVQHRMAPYLYAYEFIKTTPATKPKELLKP